MQDQKNVPYDVKDLAQAEGVKRGPGGVKLEPQPSDSPRDPLNWPLWRKWLVTTVVCLAAFVGTAQGGAYVSGVVVQSFVYDVSPIAMVYSLSAGLAGTCTGPIIWMAVAYYIGRTPVILLGLLGSIAFNTWSAVLTTPSGYIQFCISRWLAGTFGAAPTAIGASYLVEMFFLHDRGKALACYTTSTIFGVTVANTFSGFIVDGAPWPVQFWWIIGFTGFVTILVLLFLQDTSFPRDGSTPPEDNRSFIVRRLSQFVPYKSSNDTARYNAHHRPLDAIVIGVQPVTLLAGGFVMFAFAWGTAVLNNLSVYLQLPTVAGGYAFTPAQNAYFTFVNWVAVALGQLYAISLNDRIPLQRCRRNGGIWKPEYRLYPVLFMPLILYPICLGVFGAALQYHLHYMVIAFSNFLLQISDIMVLPVVNAYLVESFVGYTAEVTTILTFYRLIFGLCISFFLAPWTAAVGIGWAYGVMAFFVIVAFSFTWILEWKGPYIRTLSMRKFKGQSEEGERIYEKESSMRSTSP